MATTPTTSATADATSGRTVTAQQTSTSGTIHTTVADVVAIKETMRAIGVVVVNVV